MARTQLLSASKLRCQTPIMVCREMANTGSMPYLPTSPSALRAALTQTHKLFHPWAEHFSWYLGFRLQDSIPMPGGVSPTVRTKGSPGDPSPLVPTSSHSSVVQRLPTHPQAQCTSTAGSENHLQTCRCNGIRSTWAGAQGGSQARGFLWTALMLLAGRRQHERGGSEGSPLGRQEFSEMLFHSH